MDESLEQKYYDFLTELVNDMDFSEEMDEFCRENDINDLDREELESLPVIVSGAEVGDEDEEWGDAWDNDEEWDDEEDDDE